MKIHETLREDGTLEATLLEEDGAPGALALVTPDGRLPLPAGAVEAVLRRFGTLLEEGQHLMPVAELRLGDGAVLRHVRHLARFDVIARDYLLHEVPGQEPRFALATTVAGALAHLARANRARLG